MYAVIETGGKQYRVEVGDQVYLEKLQYEQGAEVTFDRVLAIGGPKGLKLGTPIIKGAQVTAKVIKNGKAKKITVMTYRPKKDSKRKLGHRQPYTLVQIESIRATKPRAAKAADQDEKTEE